MAAPRRLVLIADDLTGACDAGVQFASPGSPFTVVVDGAALTDRLPGDRRGVVVDTESRHRPPAEAGAIVATVADAIRTSAPESVIYKKVDSTLRGQIGAEVAALSRAFPQRIVVAAPAYPAAGRTTEGGCCLVRGVPVDETEFAHDLRTPVKSARIADHLGLAGRVNETSSRDLAPALRDASGGDVIVVDARTHSDLERIAAELVPRLEHYLMVGTAGLAAALAGEGGWLERSPGPAPVGSHRAKAGCRRVLGVVGSRSERSRAQLDVLGAEIDPLIVPLGDGGSLPEPVAWREEIAAALAAAMEARQDLVVVVAEGGPSHDPALVAELLGLAGSVAPPGVGLFLTGGDTALAVMRALGARHLRVYAEVAPGIPAVGIVAGASAGEDAAEVPAVTKAGGFGDDDAMVRAFACLKEGLCWQ